MAPKTRVRRGGGLKPPPPISISSSDDEVEEEINVNDDEESENDDDEIFEISSSHSSDEEEDEDGEDDESDAEDQSYEEEEEDVGGEDDRGNLGGSKVITMARGNDSQELNLAECKAYLRNHSLRLSGTKAECIQRMKEHLRIKDGSGEAVYPRSSFSINCTGDVCKGDVVMFTQKVYEKFDKMKRSASCLGKRTIAGRVVKESYGAEKQQHTFTLEVLWTKGIRKLPPLSPLLVKGRNLYKLKTYRQRWKNEAERAKVLAEKHRRGAQARRIREIRKANKTFNTTAGNQIATKSNKTYNTNSGRKRRKLFHERPSPKTLPTTVNKQKPAERRRFLSETNVNSNPHCRNFIYANQANSTRPIAERQPTFQPNSYPSQYVQHHRREYHQHNAPWSYYPHVEVSSSSIMRSPYIRPNLNHYGMTSSENQRINEGAYFSRGYGHSGNFSQHPGLTSIYRSPPFIRSNYPYENRWSGF